MKVNADVKIKQVQYNKPEGGKDNGNTNSTTKK